MIRPLSRWSVLISIAALLLGGLRAQEQITSSVVGRALDSSGKPLAGITVTLKNKDTQVQVQVKTEPDGSYRFNSVPIGSYSITATVAGFGVQQGDIQVVPERSASFDFLFRLPQSPPPNEKNKEKNYVDVKVFYATDRKPTGDKSPAKFYGGDRGPDGTLALGTCDVSIPREHRVGELESPEWWKLQFRQDPNKDVVLLGVVPYSESKFYSELASDVTATPARKALVFIHGFDVTFEDAARRTAQLAYDLKFQGAAIFYSWPSRGAVTEYSADEATVEWARPHLKEFLEQLAVRSNATSIYLVAHSMGNRALAGALQDLVIQARANPAPHFREVILAAPDIDAGVFRQLASSIESASDRVTLYASSNDKALAASKRIHGYARAGESGQNLVVVDGIDTIDVSAVDTSFLGHSYFADNASVVADIHNLLAGTAAAQRICLSSKALANLTYWLYGPPGVSGCPVPLPDP